MCKLLTLKIKLIVSKHLQYYKCYDESVLSKKWYSWFEWVTDKSILGRLSKLKTEENINTIEESIMENKKNILMS